MSLAALKERVATLRDTAIVDDACRYVSAYFYRYYLMLERVFKCLSGNCLDIGCGDMQFESTIRQYVDRYDTLDVRVWDKKPTYLGSVENMNMIANESYDSVVCLEVFEHIRNPIDGIKEIYRILKPSGILILTTPFLNRIHGEPDDYYRYTKYGLKHLFDSAGFQVEFVFNFGGIFTFVGHQISVAMLAIAHRVPLLGRLVRFINRHTFVPVCIWLDKVFGLQHLFPSGYICVVRK